MNYTNPRTRDEFPDSDWPYGEHTCRCRIEVESGALCGQKDSRARKRVARWTENKTRTGWNKPVRTRYFSDCAIVDGENDGEATRMFILGRSNEWDPMLLSYRPSAITIIGSDCHSEVENVANDDPRFQELSDLMDSANKGFWMGQ